MGAKRELGVLLVLLVLVVNLVSVSAVNGSIGNGRMILYPEVNGWTNTVIERTILVRNVNDDVIMAELAADSDAEEFIELIDEGFLLEPGEERKAKFEIKVKKPGKYEGKINVFFKPADNESKESGVVLSSTIIVIAGKDKIEDEEEVENPEEDVITGDVTSDVELGERKGSGILLISTIVLILVLIGLIIFSKKKRGSNKSKNKRK